MLLNQISSVYKEILEEHNSEAGQYERRFLFNSNELELTVFLGINVPSNLYFFSFVIPKNLIYLMHSDQTSGLKIILRDYDESSMRLYVSLENEMFSDIFLRLAEDLINFIVDGGDKRKTIAKLSNRLEKWKEFFKENINISLTKEACIGLIGELIILKQLLEIDLSMETLLLWRGPFGSKNDFINKNQSIEVKSTISKTKDSVRISSEYQLDTNDIDNLQLAIVILESNSTEDRGFSLHDLVSEMMHGKDALWIANFKLSLKAAHYSFDTTNRYENDKYQLHQINFYRVDDRFPKIIRSEISENIRNVQFDIALTGLEKSMINKDKALKGFLNK